MSAFNSVGHLAARRIWTGILARSLDGERLGLAVVELDPGAVAAEHSHPHEQLGILLDGTMTFTVDGETRELRPGDTWSIRGGVEHEAVAGSEGAVLIDVFAPPRDDWQALATEQREPRWPR